MNRNGYMIKTPKPWPDFLDHYTLALYELWLGATLLTKLRRDSSALDQAMLTTYKLLELPVPVLS